MSTNPKVSVVIPTYKRVDTLDRAIESVLKQTFSNIEVIIVDDNNPDTEGRIAAEKLMGKYVDNPQVRYVQHPYNKNGSAARNTGVGASTGDYVAFLDDDDEFLPEKISSMVARLNELSDDYAVCYSCFCLQKGDGKPFQSKECREGELYFEALSRQFCICAGSNLLIRKDAFKAVGGFDESFIRNQDVELLTKLLSKYKIAYCPIQGLIVHLHSNHSFFNPLEVMNQYLNNFSEQINNLSADQKKKFDEAINEERFFILFRTFHDYKQCRKMIHDGKISFGRAASVILRHALDYLKRH